MAQATASVRESWTDDADLKKKHAKPRPTWLVTALLAYSSLGKRGWLQECASAEVRWLRSQTRLWSTTFCESYSPLHELEERVQQQPMYSTVLFLALP